VDHWQKAIAAAALRAAAAPDQQVLDLVIALPGSLPAVGPGGAMKRSGTTVALVQIGEVVWERRAATQYTVVDDVLRRRSRGASDSGASLAYLPHVPALLQSYVTRYARDPSAFIFLPHIYRRLPVVHSVGQLASADIVAFSTYVWNIQLSLATARALKTRNPDVLIVMGGPQIPYSAEAFLKCHPYIDVVCHGEGERTFLDLLQHERDEWLSVPGISFLHRSGRYIKTHDRPRMLDLDEIPSPMLEGVYEELMKTVPDQQWLATWETVRGCPFACSFCDWGSATGSRVARYSLPRLRQEIDWMASCGIHHLFVCDANFGMLPRDVEIARYLALAYAERSSYVAVSIQNTKNRTERTEQIQQIFRSSRVVSFGASISLQSVSPEVLTAIRRNNISLEAFERLQRQYAQQGLETYTDLIIALPEETYGSFADGVDRVIRNGQLNRVAFYECSVLPNAPMADRGYLSNYDIATVPVPLVHAHEPLERGADEAVGEFLDVVVSTRTMSREDWVRTRTFAHLVALLLVDRVLHVPLVLLGIGYGIPFRTMFEAFLDAVAGALPTIAAVRDIFENHARALQRGGSQYLAAPQWLDIWWPVDQYVLIWLAHQGLLDTFYSECEAVLLPLAGQSPHGIPEPSYISEAVQLNRAMLALPFQWADEHLRTRFSVVEDYQAILAGQEPKKARRDGEWAVKRSATVWMSWDDWCEDLIRRHFLPRGYLYEIIRRAEHEAPDPTRDYSDDGQLQTSGLLNELMAEEP